MLNPKLVKYFTDSLFEEIIDGLWAMVKGRYRRQYDSTRQGDRLHITNMYEAQGRLPRDKYKSPSLLYAYIRRSC